MAEALFKLLNVLGALAISWIAMRKFVDGEHFWLWAAISFTAVTCALWRMLSDFSFPPY